MSLTLGIDSSTQSCSAIVISPADGKVVAEESINFGERLPQYNAPSGFIPGGKDGEVHSDPLMWLDALELLLTELADKCDLSQISAVSGAGQQHGSVYLGESWQSTVGGLDATRSLSEQIGPCLTRKTSPIWMDGSTSGECAEIAEATGGNDEVCSISGSIAIERFTGPQIRRFYKIDPDAYAATARVHLVSSFLCSVICGADSPIDTGDGAGMNLLSLSTWEWDDALLSATAPDLREKLPQIAQGDQVVGHVCRYFQEKFGLPAGVPVTVWTGDNPSSLVGMGASKPGKVVVSLGTSDTFFAAMPEVVSDPTGSGHVFGNPRGGSMSLQCFINGSLAREAVKDRFNMGWDEFSGALAMTPPGNNGNVMIPFFRPEISPRVDLNEPILRGSDAFEKWDDPSAAVRACVEGQFLNMLSCTQWMGLNPEVIYLTGGASRNNQIARVVADIFGRPVQRLQVTSSVALGAAMRAAVNSLSASWDDLESNFCTPEEEGLIQASHTDSYASAGQAFEEMMP